MPKFHNLVALLPMKEHSERVKNKNFKILKGKPLYKWILDTLLSCEEIDLIIINTDSEKLLNNFSYKSKKILIRERAKKLCGDLVSMNKIIDDDLKNVDSSIYLMTHSTNPFLSKCTIQKALKLYKEGLSEKKFDSLFTVNTHQTRFYKKNGQPINHDPKNLMRTQDLEKWYEENSNLYLFTKESFQKNNNRIGSKPFLYESPKYESIDIDDQNDWEFAEKLMGSQDS